MLVARIRIRSNREYTPNETGVIRGRKASTGSPVPYVLGGPATHTLGVQPRRHVQRFLTARYMRCLLRLNDLTVAFDVETHLNSSNCIREGAPFLARGGLTTHEAISRSVA